MLGADAAGFVESDRAWVLDHAAATLADIETATLRLVARISFVAALRLTCDEWLWCALASPGAIPKHLRNLHASPETVIFRHAAPDVGSREP